MFTWLYNAVNTGLVQFDGNASGIDGSHGGIVSSAINSSNAVNINAAAATNTFTETPMDTNTATETPTDTPTPADVFEITELVSYPNPVNPDRVFQVDIEFHASQICSDLVFKVYTSSFRLIRQVEIPGSHELGRNLIPMNTLNFKGLASGIYYYVFIGKSDNDEIKRSEVGKIIILH